jgi:hypothetical protein
VGTVPIDNRPQYNPSILVLDVQRLLGVKGIQVVIDQHNVVTATTAAADLLNALHVMPATSPVRPSAQGPSGP